MPLKKKKEKKTNKDEKKAPKKSRVFCFNEVARANSANTRIVDC